MGVLGLTPFLQKTCPNVIKSLENRLKDLTGKRIVIDGTLITQRLHFAPDPHPYRHIQGWYRLARELEESGVTAVCVFDGKERNGAKAREHDKRKETRRLIAARGYLEFERLQRLQKLDLILRRYEALDHSDRTRVFDRLKGLAMYEDAIACIPPQPRFAFHEHDLLDRTEEDTSYLSEGRSTERDMVPPFQDALSPSYDRIQDQPFPMILPTPDLEQVILDILPSDIPPAIESLFHDYHNTLSKLASFPITMETPIQPEISNAEFKTRADLMSKTQYQLTLEEGRIWAEILASQSHPGAPTGVAVNELANKSRLMSAAYRRRANTPTVATYEQCREILQAMGIPCIESTGAFEAEALASAIVRGGHADYVASEDTDVVLYEVPLLRNLTNRNEPLKLMCGADVRASLQLERDPFIDFALLLGTDFSDRIKNVGPSRALKFIKEYGTIERVIESEVKYQPRTSVSAYLERVGAARMIFRTLPAIPDGIHMFPGRRDDDKVIQLLERYNLTQDLRQHGAWNYEAALAGNYFTDDPRMY